MLIVTPSHVAMCGEISSLWRASVIKNNTKHACLLITVIEHKYNLCSRKSMQQFDVFREEADSSLVSTFLRRLHI